MIAIEAIAIIVNKDVIAKLRKQRNYIFLINKKEVPLRLNKTEFNALQSLIATYVFKYGDEDLQIKELNK